MRVGDRPNENGMWRKDCREEWIYGGSGSVADFPYQVNYFLRLLASARTGQGASNCHVDAITLSCRARPAFCGTTVLCLYSYVTVNLSIDTDFMTTLSALGEPVPDCRVGLGHDTHRFGSEKPLILGGVTVPHAQGLVGHSDADVLLHAITDALLGACGLGDIGEWFPDTDPQWAGVDSGKLLESACTEIKNRGWQIANLDCTIHAERPKLSSVKQAIRQRVAEILTIDGERVNVKAKTGERVGPVGRQEAITADAIVLLIRSNTNGNQQP